MIPHGTQIPISHQFDARRLSGVEADMEMHEIKYFLAACRTLNFHRAAELSHVSQPALTGAIQKLEAELGGHLFHRERSEIRVTDFGRLMRAHLEQSAATDRHGQGGRAELSQTRSGTAHPSRPLQPIRKDLVIRFRRQRLAREAIMAAKEISVKKYVVRLSGEERERLETLIRKGKSPARRVLKARILLKADVSEAGKGWSDNRIIEA